MIPVLAAPLFDPGADRRDLDLPEGLTIGQMIARALPDLPANQRAQVRVSLVTPMGAALVDPRWYDVTRPRRGVRVVIRVIPAKDALRSVLMIVVSVAAVALGAYFGPALAGTLGLSAGTWSAAITLGVNVLGSLLINALIPPPKPEERRNSYAISGWRNRYEPDGAVPVVMGEMRYAPPFGAVSYTEIVGDLQYVRTIFNFGYGPLELSDFRLGETPLAEYDEFQVETRSGRPGDGPITLYPRQVVEETIGAALTKPRPRDDYGNVTGEAGKETPVTRTTGDDAAGVSVIFAMPAGLVRMSKKGRPLSYGVWFKIEQRLAGTEDWTHVQDLEIWAAKTEAFYRQHTWDFPQRGRWEIRITRLTTEETASEVSDRVAWAALQTLRPEYPLNFGQPLALVGMRVKATHQINGGLDNFSASARRICLDYDHATGAWVERATSNPASLYRYALQSPANPRAVADAGLDLDQLAAWHDFCRLNNLTYNAVLDQTGTTLRDVLAEIAAAGRASPRHDGLRWGVTIDGPQDLIVDHISPRNSWGFKAHRQYVQPPHAFRVKFKDAANAWSDAERLIRWPGHDGEITLTEALPMPGKTDPDEVWREGRRRQYEAIHRPDTYEVFQDGALRVATRGDLVALSHDVIDQVQRAACVRRVIGNSLWLDDTVEIKAGGSYGIRFRVFDGPDDTLGRSVVRTVTADAGETDLLTLTGDGEAPMDGDLVLFGLAAQETRRMIVTGVEMAEDMVSLLRLVDAAPQIDQLLAQDEPEPWSGRVGSVIDIAALIPPVPRWTSVVSDADAGKSVRDLMAEIVTSLPADPRGLIAVRLEPGAGPVPTLSYRIEHRLASDTDWQHRILSAGAGGAVLTDYQIGDQVELRAVALSGSGQASAATPVASIVVGSGAAPIPTALELGSVRIDALPGGARVHFATGEDMALASVQVYAAQTNQLDRAAHTAGAAITVQPSREYAAELGDATRRNLIRDAAFSSPATWLVGAGWQISGGVAQHTPGSAGALGQALALTAGRAYRMAWSTTADAGSITPRLAGGATVTGTARAGTGRWTDELVAGASPARVEWLASSASDAQIANPLLYEATATCLPPGITYVWLEPLSADGLPGPIIGPIPVTIE
ncbi:TipJ family phage tail tip protein [Paracoccus jiaweipingae]|uniref:TipJ family phage tail tip protein n=1 Tax=Paracoccus sp. p2-l61 TaxID=3366950 RepID=UPI0037BCCC26